MINLLRTYDLLKKRLYQQIGKIIFTVHGKDGKYEKV